MQKYIIHTQVKEWYGDESHIGDANYGRYKMKGGESFVFEGPDTLYWDEPSIIEMFNKKYDREGLFFRYEAKGLEFYFAPAKAQFIDGEISIF